MIVRSLEEGHPNAVLFEVVVRDVEHDFAIAARVIRQLGGIFVESERLVRTSTVAVPVRLSVHHGTLMISRRIECRERRRVRAIITARESEVTRKRSRRDGLRLGNLEVRQVEQNRRALAEDASVAPERFAVYVVHGESPRS